MYLSTDNNTNKQLFVFIEILNSLSVPAFAIDLNHEKGIFFNTNAEALYKKSNSELCMSDLPRIFYLPIDILKEHFNKALNCKSEQYVITNTNTFLNKNIINFRLSAIDHNILLCTITQNDESNIEEPIECDKPELRFLQIFEESPILMYLTVLEDGRFLKVNKSFCESVGLKKDEIIGKTAVQIGLYSEFFHNKYIAYICSSEHPKNIEVDFHIRNGEKISGLVSTEIINIDNKRVLLQFFNDISEKKKAEIALKKSEEAYRILAENTNDIISRHNKNGIFLYASPICQNILGYSPKELIGKPYLSYIHKEDIANIIEAFSDSKLTNKVIRLRFRHKDQHYIWLESNIRLIRSSVTGEITESFAITRDISKIIEAEEFIMQKEMNLLSTKVKSDFLANLTHEIWNPMNIIFGMTNSLLRTEISHEQKNFLNSLQESSKHLKSILNDILDISKLESHDISLNPSSFNINEIADSIAAVYEEECIRKKLTFKYAIENPNNNLELCADLSKIRQCTMNLISNAIKFTHNGTVSLSLNLTEEKNKNRLIIKVSDTGIGIEEDNIPFLFQSFTQLDSSTTKEYSGTGIGLSIVQKLIEILNGSIEIQSIINEGTTITLSIPVEVKNNTDTHAPSEKNIIKKLPEKIRVLVAEDDGINQMYLKSFVKELGWEADGAYNGLQALELYAKNHYDIILMDGQMPKMDGFEATKNIRELEQKSGKKAIIIAITGYAVKGDRDRFIDAGMDDYITKPIDEEEFLTTIKMHLNRMFQ